MQKNKSRHRRKSRCVHCTPSQGNTLHCKATVSSWGEITKVSSSPSSQTSIEFTHSRAKGSEKSSPTHKRCVENAGIHHAKKLLASVQVQSLTSFIVAVGPRGTVTLVLTGTCLLCCWAFGGGVGEATRAEGDTYLHS
jgi:thiaminase